MQFEIISNALPVADTFKSRRSFSECPDHEIAVEHLTHATGWLFDLVQRTRPAGHLAKHVIPGCPILPRQGPALELAVHEVGDPCYRAEEWLNHQCTLLSLPISA